MTKMSMAGNTKCYLDANALLYFVTALSEAHTTAKNAILYLINQDYALFISSLTLDEFIHNFIRFQSKSLSKTQKMNLAVRALNKILTLPVDIVSPPNDLKSQKVVLEYMKKYSLKTRDAYHLLIMKHNKIKYFLTFDSDFDGVFKDGIVKNVHEQFRFTPPSQEL